MTLLADNIASALVVQLGPVRGKRMFDRVVARYHLPDTAGEICSLRWRCCRNLFEEGHTPWCPAGVSLDPLPPA